MNPVADAADGLLAVVMYDFFFTQLEAGVLRGSRRAQGPARRSSRVVETCRSVRRIKGGGRPVEQGQEWRGRSWSKQQATQIGEEKKGLLLAKQTADGSGAERRRSERDLFKREQELFVDVSTGREKKSRGFFSCFRLDGWDGKVERK